MSTVDLCVVGAGIVGLAHAWAGHRRGLSVRVVDRSAAIVGASVRNFGHAGIAGQAGKALEYATLGRGQWLALASRADFWARDAGSWFVARNELELRVLQDFTAARGPLAVESLSADQLCAAIPVSREQVVGGARLVADVQVNPREAAPRIAQWLGSQGVTFDWQTNVVAVAPGEVSTNRGKIAAREVIVATNHDLGDLFPEVAESNRLRSCWLDMLRVATPGRFRLPGPVLSGWSMARYSGFEASPAIGELRQHLANSHPRLAELGLNLMFTQLPDGTLLVGDTHTEGAAVDPFLQETSANQLLDQAREFFDTEFSVLERWQGSYAKGSQEFVEADPLPGVHLRIAATGIGMSTAFGLAEHTLSLLIETGNFRD